jgi:(p)ppGpp synthase/HD superfamily hydrolase
MLSRIEVIFPKAKGRKAFFQRIHHLYPESDPHYQIIEKAYNTAKDEFRHILRDTGERYFEHLRRSTLIMIDWLFVVDWRLIAAELLHDLVEDIPSWTIERVRREFGEEIARLVDWMTKPKDDKEDYFRRLPNAPRSFWLMKLSDRLDNLLTLWGCEPEKINRKTKETKDVFLVYARKELILAHEIEEALEVLEEKLAGGWCGQEARVE